MAAELNIAVIVPSLFQGGIVRSAVNIARMLAIGARENGETVKLSLGAPEGLQNELGLDVRRDLEALGIRLRFFRVETVEKSLVAPYYHGFINARDSSSGSSYVVFNDGISNFEECDFLFVISDHVQTPMPPHRPYAVALYDFVQRYVPEIFAEDSWPITALRAEFVSLARFVVCTTQQARRDAIGYAGCRPERVHVFPVEFDPPERLNALPGMEDATKPARRRRPYVLWSTIISQHENHPVVLAGLEKFFQAMDVDVVATGFHTQSFDPKVSELTVDHPYVRGIRDRIRRSALLSRRLSFRGFVDDAAYVELMRDAACILHTSTGDNGSYSVLEAAWLGTPAVSARYPAMMEISRQFGLPLTYWSATDPQSLSDALCESVRDSEGKRAALPSHDQLSAYSYPRLAAGYWARFSTLVRDALATARR